MKIHVLKSENQEVIRDFTLYACERLGINPSLIEIDELEVQGVNGMCIDLSQDEFLILVKEQKNVLQTLAHELVHVKQYMQQELGRELDRKTNDYETSWWEIEARSLSKDIMESYNEHNGTT
jgi:hypothetical protein